MDETSNNPICALEKNLELLGFSRRYQVYKYELTEYRGLYYKLLMDHDGVCYIARTAELNGMRPVDPDIIDIRKE